jgi:hypothetical protein
VLDKFIVSGLNQARVLFETIVAAVPSARLQLPAEHTQLAALTRKMLDISKAAASATPPVSTPTPEKKDVSVSLHQVLNLHLTYTKIQSSHISVAQARSTSPPSSSLPLKTPRRMLPTTLRSPPKQTQSKTTTTTS